MKLRAFNLTPGCVLDDEDLPASSVVVSVERDMNSETVTVGWLSHGEDIPEYAQNVTFYHYWDFCDKIKVIGICVNPEDPEDLDFGRDEAEINHKALHAALMSLDAKQAKKIIKRDQDN